MTLELRRELAEKLSERAIREEQNIEAIVIALLEGRRSDGHDPRPVLLLRSLELPSGKAPNVHVEHVEPRVVAVAGELDLELHLIGGNW
jgi:hypothetical protein